MTIIDPVYKNAIGGDHMFIPELNAIHSYDQMPLVTIVDKDDEILLNTPEAEWYRILYSLPWREYQPFAADYYNALYDFNQFRKKKTKSPVEASETKEDAVERIINNRPTVNKNEPVMHQPEFRIPAVENVKPEDVAPGFPPKRFKGKKPKCFLPCLIVFSGRRPVLRSDGAV